MKTATRITVALLVISFALSAAPACAEHAFAGIAYAVVVAFTAYAVAVAAYAVLLGVVFIVAGVAALAES